MSSPQSLPLEISVRLRLARRAGVVVVPCRGALGVLVGHLRFARFGYSRFIGQGAVVQSQPFPDLPFSPDFTARRNTRRKPPRVDWVDLVDSFCIGREFSSRRFLFP